MSLKKSEKASVSVESKTYLTDVDAAALMSLSPQTLRNWRSLNQGPAYFVVGARAIRYAVSDILAFMNARRITPEGDQSCS